MSVFFSLDNGVELHRESPATFWIPPQAERESLQVGDCAKCIFRIEIDDAVHVERMWVIVQDVGNGWYTGILDNDPYCTDEISSGILIEFTPDHVIQIDRGPATQ